MSDALAGLEGVKVFIDDILVYGQGDTYAQAVEDHDRKIRILFRRLRENNIKLNPNKTQFKKDKIKYMGHIISDKGI